MRLTPFLPLLPLFLLATATPPLSPRRIDDHIPPGNRHSTQITGDDPTASTRSLPDLTNCSPDQCPHNYTFQEFSPTYHGASAIGPRSNAQPYFRFMILFQTNPAIGEKKAHEHWRTVHADLTLALHDTGVDVVRYVQFHAGRKDRAGIRRLVEGGSVAFAPYDGIAEFHARDAAGLMRFIDRAFGDETIKRDQEYFVKGGVKLHVMAGYDTLIFGEGIGTSKGTNGIMPGDPRFR